MGRATAAANARAAQAFLKRETILRQLRYMVSRYANPKDDLIVRQLRALLSDADYQPASSLQCNLWEEAVRLYLPDEPVPQPIDLEKLAVPYSVCECSGEQVCPLCSTSPTQNSLRQACNNCGDVLCLCPNKSYV